MGLSFRKSIQVLPGVKVNLSKSGVSVSTGVSGLHASINSKGQIRGTASIPGTGIRYTKTKKITDFIPGYEDNKKAATKAKKEPKEAVPKQAPVEKKPKKGDISKEVMAIYAVADQAIEWIAIKNSTSNLGYENWDYLKERADKVLGGDIDTYLEIINDVNPFAELIDLGSQFSCGTDNPMKMTIECQIAEDEIADTYRDDKELLEDYVSAIALKAGRDIFALLPLWQCEVNIVMGDRTVLNSKFTRDSFESLHFDKLDASDTIKKLGGIVAV